MTFKDGADSICTTVALTGSSAVHRDVPTDLQLAVSAGRSITAVYNSDAVTATLDLVRRSFR